MTECQYCGRLLKRVQIWNHGKYCSRQCFAKSHFGEKIEWNGVQIRPGKALDVLKLCNAGMKPHEACRTVGAHKNVIRRLKLIPGAAEILANYVCLICGEKLPLPMSRKYCSKKCAQRAKYNRELAAAGKERRPIDERREIVVDLYRRGLEPSLISSHIGVSKEKVKNWIYYSGVKKPSKICPEIMAIRPLRYQLDGSNTAYEWVKYLEDAVDTVDYSGVVLLVCETLFGSGAPGRYASIVTEQFISHVVDANVRVAFCNILKNAITTIEWRGENFHMTRTIKSSGTFVWPGEEKGAFVMVSAGAFEHLISYKKYDTLYDKFADYP